MKKGVKSLVFLLFWMTVIQAHARVYMKSDLSVKTDNVSDNVTLTMSDPTRQNIKVSTYRLPRTVKPVGYRLDVKTRVGIPEDFRGFGGLVEIDFIVEEATDKIILHSENLVILRFDISIFGRKGKSDSMTMDKDPERDFLIFKRANGGFNPGMYTITIDYFGFFRNDSTGFHKSPVRYGKQRGWYAITDFEPVYARTAFPCFDEPGLKAKFNISITHHKDFTAHSNTARISTSEPDVAGIVTSRFEETPKMSTYLVAFLVSDFKSVSDSEGNLSVVARKNAIRKAGFALRMGRLVRNKLDDYVGIPYSKYMKKMDQVAVNDEKFTVAMENWGLIMYQEKFLLVDENKDQFVAIREVANTISHEFAHQWFGNVVSPKWWKYLWLSEGMSELMASSIVEQIKPKWRAMEYSIVSSVFSDVLVTDTVTGPALNNDVETPEEIESLFGSITYYKGAAVLRMMQHFLTKNIFQKGLKNYVNQKKEDSVDSDDLFQLIEQVVRRDSSLLNATIPDDLRKTMDTWVNRPGYPLITVTRNYTDNTVVLEQECFIASGINKTKENCSSVWSVPISYSTTMDLDFNDTTAQLWLTNKSAKIDMSLDPEHWIMLNKQATGYYRVNYDERNWLLIIEYLKSSQASLESIHALNRAQLLNDALALVKIDRLSLSIFLRLVAVLESETDEIVWTIAIDLILWLRERLILSEYNSSLQKYFKKLNENMNDQLVEWIKQTKQISWSESIMFDSQNIYFDHDMCHDNHNLRNVFNWIVNKTTFSSHVAPLIPCCDYRNAPDEEVRELLGQFSSEKMIDDNYQQSKILCFDTREALRLYVSLTHGNEMPHDHGTGNSFSRPSNDPEFDFIIQEFASLFDNDLNTLGVLADYLGYATTTENELNKLRELKLENEVDQEKIQDVIEKAIHTAEERVPWLERNKQILMEWAKEMSSRQ